MSTKINMFFTNKNSNSNTNTNTLTTKNINININSYKGYSLNNMNFYDLQTKTYCTSCSGK